ncbi:MAG TPA: APC family permease [Candidatus Angelobacter sp.]|nr:APC family permease [Candidatus Angelobacter sp.]
MKESNNLKKNHLSIIEVLALSVSIIAPTMAMAFNTAGAAGQAGTGIPLAFLVSTIAILLCGVSFVEFSKRISHSGSVYAYNSRGLGPRAGLISGWAILATYFCYMLDSAALFGSFLKVFLGHFSIGIPEWIAVLIGIALVWIFALRDVKMSTRAALLMELISVAVLLILAFTILGKGGASGLTAQPFTLKGSSFSGVGMAMVFGILSFAGFEGASTLGEEAKNPRRAIPLSIFGTVVLAGLFFVFISYTEVIGFGVHHIDKLAGSASPLDDLATRFIGGPMGIFIDFAAMISAFACALGSANACSRMIFALSRDGILPRALSHTHVVHKTPNIAVHVIGILCTLFYFAIGIFVGAGNFYNYVATTGTLTLLVAYVLINIAAIRYFRRDRQNGYSVLKHGIIPSVSILIMLWPIWNNIYPIPKYPFNILPYIALAWIIIGIIISYVKLTPEVKKNMFSDEMIG